MNTDNLGKDNMKNNDIYKDLSFNYDLRFQNDENNPVWLAVKAVRNISKDMKILEIGCGTGHNLQQLYNLGYRKISGIDLSESMIAKAKAKLPDVELLNADAESLPFTKNTFDIIIIAFAHHQFINLTKCLEEANRVLKKNGRLMIINIQPRKHKNHSVVFNYFPSAYKIDLNRYLSEQKLENLLSRIGFKYVRTQMISQQKLLLCNEEILNYYFIQKDSSSTLAMISDLDYQKGIEIIKEKISEAKNINRKYSFNIVTSIFMTTGLKNL